MLLQVKDRRLCLSFHVVHLYGAYPMCGTVKVESLEVSPRKSGLGCPRLLGTHFMSCRERLQNTLVESLTTEKPVRSYEFARELRSWLIKF